MRDKVRIAWFSPLNTGAAPGPTVSGYVSDMLLLLLRRRFDIELFHDSFSGYLDFRTAHFLTAARRHQEKPFDLFFYQLEDRRECNFVRMHLALFPGLVYFHNFIFTSDGPEPILNSPWTDVVDLFAGKMTEWPERGREYKSRGPAGLREGGMAAVSLFPNPALHAEFKRVAESRIVGDIDMPESFFLPYPVAIAADAGRREDPIRRVLFCGSPRIEHRAHILLEALTRVTKPYTLVWLIEEQERGEAEGMLHEFAIEDFQLIVGRSPARWSEEVEKGGVAVHTIFSVYSQPGPYPAISLMAGLPSVVTHFGFAEHLSDKIICRLMPGEGESYELSAVLGELLGSKRSYREAAQSYAVESHDSLAVAAELGTVFDRAAVSLAPLMKRWLNFQGAARSALLQESAQLLVGTDVREEGIVSGEFLKEYLVNPAFKDLGWQE